jgi:crotonobetainyl-CoA:carnitine CoA-transferase CaiB-like acyl-CoA transferase
MSAAFAGLRVIDLSESIAGQYCARLLADFGADVTLVEPPGGSVVRRTGPFDAGDPPQSLLFFHLNAGKRSVAIDRAAGGAALLRALAVRADVALVGSDADRAVLRAANPHLVIGLTTPFGTDGPLAGWKSNEMILQALSGMMHNNGEPGRPPLYGCGQRASYGAGVASYIGIVAALIARRAGAPGQDVTIDAAETAAAMGFPYVMQHIYNGAIRRRGDQTQPVARVRCSDGWLCIWIYNHRFAAACRTLGVPQLIDDPRFAAPLERLKNWDALVAILQDLLAERNAEEIVAALQAAQIIAAKASRPSELRHDRHLAARAYWEAVESDDTMKTILGAPFRLSRTPRRVRGGAPSLGEGNRDLPDADGPKRAGTG